MSTVQDQSSSTPLPCGHNVNPMHHNAFCGSSSFIGYPLDSTWCTPPRSITGSTSKSLVEAFISDLVRCLRPQRSDDEDYQQSPVPLEHPTQRMQAEQEQQQQMAVRKKRLPVIADVTNTWFAHNKRSQYKRVSKGPILVLMY